MIQQASARSIQDEMVQAQNVAKERESRVAELKAKKKHTVKKLRRMEELEMVIWPQKLVLASPRP